MAQSANSTVFGSLSSFPASSADLGSFLNWISLLRRHCSPGPVETFPDIVSLDVPSDLLIKRSREVPSQGAPGASTGIPPICKSLQKRHLL